MPFCATTTAFLRSPRGLDVYGVLAALRDFALVDRRDFESAYITRCKNFPSALN
jgi:hypothetical protein